MAQHVLCPNITTQKACVSDPVLQCAWNPRKQQCEADKYASFLLPLSCPGSPARMYLNCMRKPSEAACTADATCYAAHHSACLPRSMLAQARSANVSVQSLAEQVAIGLLRGEPNSKTHRGSKP